MSKFNNSIKLLAMEKENYHLTEKEMQVLNNMLVERNSAEIADIMNLSIHTVQYHQQSMIRKFDVKTVSDIVPFAKNHHLC